MDRFDKVNRLEGSPGYVPWFVKGCRQGLGKNYPITLEVYKKVDSLWRYENTSNVNKEQIIVKTIKDNIHLFIVPKKICGGELL